MSGLHAPELRRSSLGSPKSSLNSTVQVGIGEGMGPKADSHGGFVNQI